MAFATVNPPALCSALPTADKLKSGFRLEHKSLMAEIGLECWLSLPDRPAKTAPPLVAIHGIKRAARQQAALLGARAAANGQAVIAPMFDEKNWPRYQQLVKKGRADRALIKLIAALRAEGIIGDGLTEDGPIELCGFSGGAQFSHRFAMLYPEKISRLTTASAGWYTFPDAAPFPYGFGPKDGSRRASNKRDWGAHMAKNLERFLRIPINVVVGSKDSVPDLNTRSCGDINQQQGRTRLARAANWADALKREAEKRGILAQIDFTVLPGCGHDFRQCVEKGGLDRFIIPNLPRATSIPPMAPNSLYVTPASLADEDLMRVSL